MKKLFSMLLALILGATCLFTATACGKKDELAIGSDLITYDSQLDALTQLKAGSVDAVVIDSVMAGYYEVEGDFVGEIAIVDNLILAQEEYGIAGRKDDKAFMSEINKALIALNAAGAVDTIAELFGVQDSLALDGATNPYAGATDNSWNKIKEDGKIVVGYTVFAPIAYTKAGQFTGFDTELARAVVACLNQMYSLNLEIEFKEIDWDTKEALLSNGTIDLIWNGLTITEERASNMCISVPYLYNNQVAVVKASDVGKYSDKDSFSDAIMGAEAGSAGESVIKGE